MLMSLSESEALFNELVVKFKAYEWQKNSPIGSGKAMIFIKDDILQILNKLSMRTNNMSETKIFSDVGVVTEELTLVSTVLGDTSGIVIKVTGGPEQEIVLEKAELQRALKLLEEKYPDVR